SAKDQCDNDCSPDQACLNCLTTTIGGCVSSKCSAELSECSGGTPADIDIEALGSATCADLEACCNSLSDDQQASCTMQLESVRAGGDLGCSVGYATYKASGLCP